ncbi:uncharacterized protein LOC143914677 [Arctopsyche grandis]|uniref:uncharacterized protein LOC143914677 n=1 Tax=Arctopsyche grandis TaxID=121162 RepID=UPI00406D957A
MENSNHSKIINEIRKRPRLWNRYHKKQSKEWTKIACILGLSVDVVKKHWMMQRAKFFRELRRSQKTDKERKISFITNKAFKSLGFLLRSTKPFNDPYVLKLLYFSFVRSHLEFASIIWSPFYLSHINCIEKVQLKFIKSLRYLFPTYTHSTVSDILKILSFNNLSVRRRHSDAIFFFKLINGFLDCSDLLNKVNFRIPVRYPRRIALFSLDPFNTNSQKYFYLQRVYRMFNGELNEVDLFGISLHQFRSNIKRILTD